MEAVIRKALVAVLVACAAGCSGGEDTAGATSGTTPPPCLPAKEPLGADPAKGESFPDVDLTTCDGAKVTLDTLRCQSTIMLVSIGAGWCQPCIEETPSLETASIELRDEGIGVVQVLFQDAMANPATTLFCTKWVDQFALTMPVFIDPVGDTLGPFEAAAAPFNVVVDRDGKVLWAEVGVVPADLQGTLRSLLPK
jgi:thiol-disulfide isomerase/thioredoxin